MREPTGNTKDGYECEECEWGVELSQILVFTDDWGDRKQVCKDCYQKLSRSIESYRKAFAEEKEFQVVQ